MKCIYFVALIFCVRGCCGDVQRIRQSEGSSPEDFASYRIRIDADGRVPNDCAELKSLPYHEHPRKCFGGKSSYNAELSLSHNGIICPYGPVTRAKGYENLPSYSTAVKVPFDRAFQSVRLYSDTIFERANDRMTVLLLTFENMMDWKNQFVRVEEIPPDECAECINKELGETESIVVFNKQGIYVKCRGDKKFRGYLFGKNELGASRTQ